jgi:hypothetical protein
MSSKARRQNEPDWGFEWPPKQRIVSSEIVELEKSSSSDAQTAAPSQQPLVDNPLLELITRSPLPLPLPVRLPEPQAAEAVPAAQPRAAAAVPSNAVPREELPAEVQEELRGLDADFWGPIALDNYLKRGWIMPTAIVVLALVAVVEGVFLLRGRSEEPYVITPAPASQPQSSTLGQQLARPTVPPIATAPPIASGPTTSSNIPPASANRAPAANDVASGRSGAQPRQTPTAQPARPAPAVATSNPPVREPGWVTISAPIELNVSEKGTLLGTTRGPRILLSPGGHVLQLESPTFGYRENQWVRIHSGRATTLPVALPQGIVHVNATPWADISIDGKSFGQTPIGNLKLTIGSYEVVFRHPQLGEKTVSALVKVGSPTRVSADLTQK